MILTDSIFRAIAAFFEFLCTDEGKLLAKEWREDRTKLRADIAGLVEWLKVARR